MVSQIIVLTTLAFSAITGGDASQAHVAPEQASVVSPEMIVNGTLHVSNGDGMIGTARI